LFAARNNVAAIYSQSVFVRDGGLLSYALAVNMKTANRLLAAQRRGRWSLGRSSPAGCGGSAEVIE
jgi:hypothetical protein